MLAKLRKLKRRQEMRNYTLKKYERKELYMIEENKLDIAERRGDIAEYFLKKQINTTIYVVSGGV